LGVRDQACSLAGTGAKRSPVQPDPEKITGVAYSKAFFSGILPKQNT